MFACVCRYVCVYIICPLILSREKKHDFEQAYTLNTNKGPTHILKNKKKNVSFRGTTTVDESYIGKVEVFIGKILFLKYRNNVTLTKKQLANIIGIALLPLTKEQKATLIW